MAFSRNLVGAERYKKGIKEMRWSKRKKRQLSIGDQRTKKKFLIIPKCLPGGYGGTVAEQWRWFERSRIIQELKYKRWFPILGENNVWENVSWGD